MSSSSRPYRSSTYSASRPRSTASAPSTYFSAFTSPPYTKPRSNTSSSAYKRSPRPNFIVRVYEKVRKLIRDFLRYARKNPLKVIIPLIMALIGGGALTGLVKRMGGLQALGLGNLGGLGGGFDINRLVGATHGIRTASNSFAGLGQEGAGVFDAWTMGKGAIKIASAFL